MVGEVDLLVGDRVVVEIDGFAHHSDRVAFQEDRRRDRELVAQGYVVLRFTAAEVLRDPALVGPARAHRPDVPGGRGERERDRVGVEARVVAQHAHHGTGVEAGRRQVLVG